MCDSIEDKSPLETTKGELNYRTPTPSCGLWRRRDLVWSTVFGAVHGCVWVVVFACMLHAVNGTDFAQRGDMAIPAVLRMLMDLIQFFLFYVLDLLHPGGFGENGVVILLMTILNSFLAGVCIVGSWHLVHVMRGMRRGRT